MPFEVTTATAPKHWASYLINGDASGFDYSNVPGDEESIDKAECDAWTERLYKKGGWYVVSTDDEESTFRHSNDAGTLPGDCLTYILHRQVKE